MLEDNVIIVRRTKLLSALFLFLDPMVVRPSLHDDTSVMVLSCRFSVSPFVVVLVAPSETDVGWVWAKALALKNCLVGFFSFLHLLCSSRYTLE